MVNFAGCLLPVQYADLSIANSHVHTRKHASLFDVSHMLQTEIRGKECIPFFEKLCTADIASMNDGASALTVFTNEGGGILDDLIVTKLSDDHLYVVSNAGRKEHDQQLMLNALKNYKNVGIRFFDPSEQSLIALQGPKAAETLQKLTDVNLSELYFMNSTVAHVAGVNDCRITRCGYTGEDGFEISLPSDTVIDVTTKILKNDVVKLAGLGARDSLRLEAGLCLYGNDISETTSPIEAALTWLVSKTRRERRDFPGADVILNQIKNGVRRKRVGFVQESGPPARQDALIYHDGQEIGVITSGCPAPSLGKNVSMGYVSTEFGKVGTKLKLKIREKMYDTVVAKMPFVPAHYYTKANVRPNFGFILKTSMSTGDSLGPSGGDDGIVGGPRTPQQVAAQKRLQQTQAQVDEVVDIMKTNVEKVLERDQKLSELDDRADALQQGASQFEQQAGKLKRKFWLQNLKMMIIMGAIGLVILIIIIMKFMPESSPQPSVQQYNPALMQPGAGQALIPQPGVAANTQAPAAATG
ncbi:hypothetical protein RN001_010485 [Aquatica leii]|uniref:Aminomethyltransferase, mitochondrial n=1 Tax=Aquatica leii TaxID=1421715 RepID=A0AAN7SG15_9COLE|nr:hypothetical protein RN001_010485 [Aquatica leii]